MIFDAKSRIPAKYYNLATWNFRQQRALFRLELLTQLPWRGKWLMTHPQFRCPGKGIPPMKCSKDGIEILNHPILGRRPDSDVIGIPEFLRGNIQRILEFQDLLFLLETHSTTIWSTFCLKETIQPLQTHETVFLQTSLNTPGTHHCTPHLLPINPHWTWFLSPTVIGCRLSTMVLAAVDVQFILQQIKCWDVSTKTLDSGDIYPAGEKCWWTKSPAHVRQRKYLWRVPKEAQNSLNVSRECRFNRGISSPIYIDTWKLYNQGKLYWSSLWKQPRVK